MFDANSPEIKVVSVRQPTDDVPRRSEGGGGGWAYLLYFPCYSALFFNLILVLKMQTFLQTLQEYILNPRS